MGDLGFIRLRPCFRGPVATPPTAIGVAKGLSGNWRAKKVEFLGTFTENAG